MSPLSESNAQILCKSCGLCCSGHLFAWVRLNAPELDRVEALGLKVIRDDPRQRGFLQPCPVWRNGVCVVYTSPDYPSSCRKYRCAVLRKLTDGEITLPDAMNQIRETLDLIREIEQLLPASPAVSFRERLIAHKENLEKSDEGLDGKSKEFLLEAGKLLDVYENRFGVDDFIDYDS